MLSCTLSPITNMLTQLFTLHTYPLIFPDMTEHDLSHITCERKWHFLFSLQIVSGGRLMSDVRSLGYSVSSSKSHPLIFEHVLSMQTVLISAALSINLVMSDTTKWQSCRMTSHHFTLQGIKIQMFVKRSGVRSTRYVPSRCKMQSVSGVMDRATLREWVSGRDDWRLLVVESHREESGNWKWKLIGWQNAFVSANQALLCKLLKVIFHIFTHLSSQSDLRHQTCK